MHGGDQLVAVLKAQHVPVLFTLSGGHISPILTAAKANGIRVVDVRDEATTVFAADAVSRLSGTPGVAVVTAGPGITNTITAVKNAQLAQSAVVIIGGAAPTALQGRGALQDIDQLALMRPLVKKAWSVRRVRDLGPSLERAFEIAQSDVPGPVFLECPIDVLYEESMVRELYLAGGGGRSLGAKLLKRYLEFHVNRIFADSGRLHASRSVEPQIPRAPQGVVDEAAAALGRSERPVMLIGSQAVVRPAQIPALVEAVNGLGIPAYLSGMARGLLGAESALQCRHQRRRALKEADLVILSGVPCDFRLDYGRHIRGDATLISVNRGKRDLKLNRKPDIGALGDPADFVIRLAQACGGKTGQSSEWRPALAQRDRERETEIAAKSGQSGDGVNALRLCRGIDAILPENGLIVADGGDFVATASYILRPRGPLAWMDPGVFGTLGVGAGFALGAKLVRPDSSVWCIFGDGAFGYSSVEMDTFVRHQLPVAAIIGNDGGWTQIAREQVKILGDDVATVLSQNDYHQVARAWGAEGLLLEGNSQIEAVLEDASQRLERGSTVLVNALLGRSDFREGSISM